MFSKRNYLWTMVLRFFLSFTKHMMWSESTLPRTTRSLISQLRSGYSSNLNSYLSRLREDVIDECLDCQIHSHTTKHLFNWPENPTPFTVRDLRNNPTEVGMWRWICMRAGPGYNNNNMWFFLYGLDIYWNDFLLVN